MKLPVQDTPSFFLKLLNGGKKDEERSSILAHESLRHNSVIDIRDDPLIPYTLLSEDTLMPPVKFMTRDIRYDI